MDASILNSTPSRIPLSDLLRRTATRFERQLQGSISAQYPDLRRAAAALLPCIPENGIGLTALAKSVGSSKQAITRPVASLVRGGYVELVKNPTDGRAVILRLTAKGHEYLGASSRSAGALETELAALVGAARLTELRSVLGTIESALAQPIVATTGATVSATPAAVMPSV